MYKKENYNKFIVCKKEKNNYLCYPRLFLTSKDAFYDIVKRSNINLKEHVRRHTKERYLEESKFLMEDCNWKEKDLFKYDGLPLDFFEKNSIYDVYNIYTKNHEVIVFDKGKINYSEILSVLTGRTWEICRLQKAIDRPNYYIQK